MTISTCAGKELVALAFKLQDAVGITFTKLGLKCFLARRIDTLTNDDESSVKTEGITKNTHIALADRSAVTDKSSCLAVELPKGSVRDALNLVDRPELRGKRVYVKGNVVSSYFGTTGLKNVKEYRLP